MAPQQGTQRMQIQQFKKYVAVGKLMVLENYWELRAEIQTTTPGKHVLKRLQSASESMQ